MTHSTQSRHAVGSLRPIRIVRPYGDPHQQVRSLVRGHAVGARYVLMYVEHEHQLAYAFFDALDQFVLDKSNKRYAGQMPLGFIKVTPTELHVMRNYVSGVTPPAFPIVCVHIEDRDITKHVRRLMYGDNGRGGLAANKYILLSALCQDHDRILYTEQFVTALNTEVATVARRAHAQHSLRACPLGLIVYNQDVLSCWENYAHWGLPRA